MWDVFTAHRAEEMKSFTRAIGIRLEFIPPGMTAECQPLDQRILGNIKARARRWFNDYWAVNQSQSMKDSIAMLLDAWKSISQEEGLDAWDVETT
jgi:hypothetical protein